MNTAEHKPRKSNSNAHPATKAIVPSSPPPPGRQTSASSSMIEAFDRLGQRLDEVAGLFREQIEIWRQTSPPAFKPSGRENAAPPVVETTATQHAPVPAETILPVPAPQDQPQREQPTPQRRPTSPNATPQDEPGLEQPPTAASTLATGEASPAPQISFPTEDSQPEKPISARSFVDTLARAGGGLPQPSADVEQALEAIMAHLEKQAANAAPQVDLAGILHRLQDLEEQQQNMQSQFNTNRWGP